MIDWAERSLCILLSLCILANALLVRRSVQAWAFPAVLFSLAWFFYTIVPLVCFPSAHVYPIAILYIFFATVAVSVSSVSSWHSAFEQGRKTKAYTPEYFGSKILLISFFLAFILAVFCLFANSIVQGISLTQLVTNVNDSAAEYAERRYSYDISSNIYQQSSNVLAYFCAGLGGIIMNSQRNTALRYSIIALSLFPSVFVMLSQSAKGMLFLCVAIFYGGVIVSRVQHGRTSLISRGAIPAVFAGFFGAIALVTISFLARGASARAGEGLIDALAPYWASYTSGHLFAFSDWFGFYIGAPSSQPYDDPGLTSGFYTFMSIFKVFGDDRPVPNGIYAEFLAIPPYIQTNIYTVFRGLITDFGLTGSLIVLSLLSFASHRAYYYVVTEAKPAFSASIVIFTVAFIYQSFGVSSLTWATLPAGLALIGFSLFFAKFKDDARIGTAPTIRPSS